MADNPELPVGEATPAQQKRSLAGAVQREVFRGYRIESQTDFNAVLIKGKRPNHVLHLILTIITAGLWAFVWIIVWAANRESRLMLSVDDYGNVLRQPV